MAANPMATAHAYVWESLGPPSAAPATDPSRIPVIVAAADLRQKGLAPEKCGEPLALIVDAARAAAEDALPGRGNELLGMVDGISLVATWSWPYLDLPSSVARGLGLDPAKLRRREYTTHSGNQPIRLVDDACKMVSRGELKAVLVGAGEALKTLEEWRKKGITEPPGWEATTDDNKTGAQEKAGVAIKSPSARAQRDTMIKHGAFLAIHAYPMMENAVRAARGQSYVDNMKESAELYAEFSDIASRVESSWNYGEKPKSAAEIGDVSPKNRMISYPYPLLQNALNTVNLAATVVVTSLATALSLGIPPSKLSFPLAGAGTQDPTDFLDRWCYDRSPALEFSIESAVRGAGLRKEDVDVWDIYSCFPIVPKCAARFLGLPVLAPARTKPVTLLGGLTSFGGAGNAYSLFALVRMAHLLRGTSRRGVVLGNGGFFTYQHALALSGQPSGIAYPTVRPLPPVLKFYELPTVIESLEPGTSLPVTVETYTIIYGRVGPDKAALVCRVRGPGRERVVANADPAEVLRMQEAGREVVGAKGEVKAVGSGMHWLTFEGEGRPKM
ncbi:acetyl-CoA acetyltransferase [Hyaloraphidium curvatum]|nr:acetyl-CoA acetyltransferase [Hyaloraphidium curvatum]